MDLFGKLVEHNAEGILKFVLYTKPIKTNTPKYVWLSSAQKEESTYILSIIKIGIKPPYYTTLSSTRDCFLVVQVFFDSLI